jgi:hypothetical protein
MKAKLFLPMFLVSFALVLNAQDQHGSKTRYGIEINQFITGSGFGSGTEAYLTVAPDHRKLLGMGVYYSPENKKITGLTVHHERSLIRFDERNIPVILPYAFYNLIYRKTNIPEVKENQDQGGERVTYTSMEHHVGFGLRFNVWACIQIKTEAGYGIYLGSIKKPSTPDPITGEISGTSGFSGIAKIGICYTF